MAKFLIVDDSAMALKSLERHLVDQGHEVAGQGANGKEAIELAGQVKPDAIILDIIMPEMDGISALKEISKLYPNIPVSMATSVEKEATEDECRALGAKYFLKKPFTKESVEDMVKALF